MALDQRQHPNGCRRSLGDEGVARLSPLGRGEPVFKDLLRLARLEQALSLHQPAERSHVDVAYLHRLEDGQASRSGRNVAIRIAIGLSLDLDATEVLLQAAGHLPLAGETKGRLHALHPPQGGGTAARPGQTFDKDLTKRWMSSRRNILPTQLGSTPMTTA